MTTATDPRPRSRRAILAAALGGIGAAALNALGRPSQATAANGNAIKLGISAVTYGDADNTATSETGIKTTGGIGFRAQSVAADGMGAHAVGTDQAYNGIYAVTWGPGGNGVHGFGNALNATGVAGQSGQNATGVLGLSGGGALPAAPAKTGVYGIATQDSAARGVHGKSTSGQGVRGEATTGIGVYAKATGTALQVDGSATVLNAAGDALAAHTTGVADAYSAVRAISDAPAGKGVHGTANNGAAAALRGDTTSPTGRGVHGINTAGSAGGSGVVGQATAGTGVLGFSGTGSLPAAPLKTGVYGVYGAPDVNSHGVHGLSGSGRGVFGESTSGTGVYGASGNVAVAGYASPSGIGVFGSGITGVNGSGDQVGVLGTGLGIGVEGQSSTPGQPAIVGQTTGNSTGVLGSSGGLSDGIPTAPDKTGVYGYAAQDGAARGVFGQSTSGQGVHGEATSGTGVYASAAANGTALQVAGRAAFSRSGKAVVPANASYVDITPGGGLTGATGIVATLQANRSGVWVRAVRLNYPSTGQARIYLNKVASTTLTTGVAWFVLG